MWHVNLQHFREVQVVLFFPAICELILVFTIRWQPWKANQIHLAGEVQKFGNLQFDFQGSQNLHIRAAISLAGKYLPDNGENVNLECPATGIFCAFCLTLSLWNWSVLWNQSQPISMWFQFWFFCSDFDSDSRKKWNHNTPRRYHCTTYFVSALLCKVHYHVNKNLKYKYV